MFSILCRLVFGRCAKNLTSLRCEWLYNTVLVGYSFIAPLCFFYLFLAESVDYSAGAARLVLRELITFLGLPTVASGCTAIWCGGVALHSYAVMQAAAPPDRLAITDIALKHCCRRGGKPKLSEPAGKFKP